MQPSLKTRIAGLGRYDLTPLVRRVLDDTGAEVGTWTTEPVEGGSVTPSGSPGLRARRYRAPRTCYGHSSSRW